MATEKVGIYRNYYGPIPTDSSGKPLPRSQWPRKRAHSWVVRWFGFDGQRYSKSFKTRKEAARFKEDKQEEVRAGRADPPEEITVSDFLAGHEKVMRDQVARESLADQVRALNMLMEHVGESTLLQDIRPRQAESFVAARLASGVAIATANKDIRTLKRIFNLAIDPRGYLPPGQNPFGSIKQRRQSSRPIRYVTPEEFQKLLAVAPTVWWGALFSVAYTTAARLGEILNLTWADVDFEQNRIRVVRKDLGASLVAWEPKDHEGRILHVPVEVMRRLVDLQVESAEGCPYVFVPAWRWRHIKKVRKSGKWKDSQCLLNNLNRRLATLRKKGGLMKFTYHDLRRSCITNWAKAMPAHVVQQLAGHSSIKTTQQYYLSVQEDDLEKARRVQSAILEVDPTDQILTNSGRNGCFSGRKQKRPGV